MPTWTFLSARGARASVGGSHYVYVLARPNGEPFYVGKGFGPRILRHEKDARNGVDDHRCRIIRGVWAAGGSVGHAIDSLHESESDTFDREVELIRRLGRSDLGTGPLANKTGGGDGVCDCAPETREKFSRNMKRRWRDPQLRHKYTVVAQEAAKDPVVAAAMRGGLEKAWAQWDDSERRAEMCKARRDGFTPKRKAALAVASKARWADASYRGRVLQTRKTSGLWSGANAARADAMRARWADPAYRERVLAARKGKIAEKWRDPVYRAKMESALGELGKRRRGDPTYRAKVADNVRKAQEANKRNWANPEYRAKNQHRLRALIKARWAKPVEV